MSAKRGQEHLLHSANGPQGPGSPAKLGLMGRKPLYLYLSCTFISLGITGNCHLEKGIFRLRAVRKYGTIHSVAQSWQNLFVFVNSELMVFTHGVSICEILEQATGIESALKKKK